MTDSLKLCTKVQLYYAKRNGTTAFLPEAGVGPLNIHIKVSHLGGCDTGSAPIFARGMGGSLALPPQNNHGATCKLTNRSARFPVETGDLMASSVWYFFFVKLAHLIISSFAKKAR